MDSLLVVHLSNQYLEQLYRLAKSITNPNKMIKEAGFASEDKLFRFGYLGFAFDNEAQAWLLVAKRDRMEKPYAREQPDRSWQLWRDEENVWADSHPSVCARQRPLEA